MNSPIIKKNSAFLYLLIIVWLIGIWNCDRAPHPLILPPKIVGLPKIQQISGKQASKIIEDLHGEDVSPEQSLIGVYGSQELPAIIYISRFSSARKAKKYLNKMSKKIGPGRSGFAHHTEFKVNGDKIHFVVGMGQAHYFFARGSDLYWLSLPMEKARQGLAEVLQVPVNQVPGIPDLMQQNLRQ